MVHATFVPNISNRCIIPFGAEVKMKIQRAQKHRCPELINWCTHWTSPEGMTKASYEFTDSKVTSRQKKSIATSVMHPSAAAINKFIITSAWYWQTSPSSYQANQWPRINSQWAFNQFAQIDAAVLVMVIKHVSQSRSSSCTNVDGGYDAEYWRYAIHQFWWYNVCCFALGRKMDVLSSNKVLLRDINWMRTWST